MAPTSAQLLAAVRRAGVDYDLSFRWDDDAIAATGTWDPRYVILHHTGNGGAAGDAPTLGWVIKDAYYPIRACHFLVARSGMVHVITAHKCYHAGAGGPGAWGNGPHVAADAMNGHAYGIEIESKGTSLDASGADGYTPEQYVATAALTRELLALIGSDVGCAINHRTWAPKRKTDTLTSDAVWHALIKEDTVALTAAEMDTIARTVWAQKFADPDAAGAEASAASLLLRARHDAHVAATATPAAGAPATGGVDVDAIAAAVVALLGARLDPPP